MRSDAARADRSAQVRRAARAWSKAGVLDAAGLAAVEQRYPDDRVRVGTAFRVLLFLFTLFAFCGLFGVAALTASGSEGALAFLLLLAGIALCGLTEWLTGPLRRRQGGIEAAASLLALSCLLGGASWIAARTMGFDLAAHLGLLLLATAGLLAAAAWRWGYPFYAGAAAVAILLAFARLPIGRLLWIGVPLLAAWPLLRLAETPRLPPALRAAASAALLVGLAGLYAAVNPDSWERGWIEALAFRRPAPSAAASWPHGVALWWCAAGATLLVPACLLIHGARRRRVAILVAGAVGAVASLITLQEHTTLFPAWLALALGGALTIALALWLWRWLDSGPGGERHGFTAAPLFADSARQHALEIAAVVITLPHAPPQPAAAEPGFTGAGGRAGGGGASGEF
jgi:hypothetical protein